MEITALNCHKPSVRSESFSIDFHISASKGLIVMMWELGSGNMNLPQRRSHTIFHIMNQESHCCSERKDVQLTSHLHVWT